MAGSAGWWAACWSATTSPGWYADRDARNVEAARREDKAVYFGDAARPDFLMRCGLDTAPALVVTMDSPEGAEAVVATARQLRPDLEVVVARAATLATPAHLYELGATDAVPETIEASLRLSRALLVDLDVPMEPGHRLDPRTI